MKAKQVYALKGTVGSAIDPVDKMIATGNDLDLDFADASFISVEGLEWLEELLLRSESMNVTVNFINVPNPIYKVFKVVKIDRFMKACGTLPARGPAC